VDWGTLAATVSGAVIAISGTVLADRLRTRDEDDRGLEARRREVYIAFITAAGASHAQLRQLVQDPGTTTDLEAASRAALTDAGLYEVRERLFIDARSEVAGAGQAMFERLRELRRAAAAGVSLASPGFHDAYHPYLGGDAHRRRRQERRQVDSDIAARVDKLAEHRVQLRGDGRVGALGLRQLPRADGLDIPVTRIADPGDCSGRYAEVELAQRRRDGTWRVSARLPQCLRCPRTGSQDRLREQVQQVGGPAIGVTLVHRESDLRAGRPVVHRAWVVPGEPSGGEQVRAALDRRGLC